MIFKHIFLLLALVLSACGGSPSAGPAPGSAGATYKVEPGTTGLSTNDMLTLLNAQGSSGYRYVGDVGFGNENPPFKSYYIRTISGTYSYELLTLPASDAALVAQANAEGARGYQFVGQYVQGALYRKNSSASTTTFSYQALPSQATADKTTAYFLTQANAQGLNGFRSLVEFNLGGALFYLYEKAAPSTAIYNYEVLPAPLTAVNFLSQVNNQGARGYRFKTPSAFGAQGVQSIYEKDTAQAATFAFTALDASTSSSALVDQANSQDELNLGWVGDYGLADGTVKTLYFSASQCTGLLCEVRTPFGL